MDYDYVRIWLQWMIDFLARLETKLRRLQRPRISLDIELEQLDAEQLTFAVPYFVLSTGRCGTLWLTKLLRFSKYTSVNHSDYPELIRHSRLAYEQYEQAPRIFCEIIRATRDEWITNAYRHGQTYVETNNRITFFAYAVRQVYPRAKFIHLVRHPGDFVRSGLDRKWYGGEKRHDLGRVVKAESPELWRAMGNVEKIAWLWNETNRYIEDFVAGLDQEDYIRVRAEDMFNDLAVAMSICEFIGVDDIPPGIVIRMLKRRVNRQRERAVDPYGAWPNSEKESVRRQAVLAARYGYEL